MRSVSTAQLVGVHDILARKPGATCVVARGDEGRSWRATTNVKEYNVFDTRVQLGQQPPAPTDPIPALPILGPFGVIL